MLAAGTRTGGGLRILLLIIQFPPDVNSTGVLMAQLGEGLIARGHQVSVVTTFPHYQQFRVWGEYRGKLAQRTLYKGMDVLHLWVYASGSKQKMLHRLLSYVSFNALAAAAGLVSREQYDVVLCTNGSFFTGITAAMIGTTKRIPVVYNVQDLYPETPVAAGQLTNRRAIATLAWIERLMYRLARHVTVITPVFKHNILGKGVPADKVSVIPNFVDTEFIRPLPKANPWSEAWALADKFVVTHAGNVGYVYDLETMLEAAALLRREREILFLIVGEGVAKPLLQRKAAALDLDNVRFLPYQSHEILPWLRATSDVQVSLYKQAAARYSMPCKLYEIMASGRPILASADRASDVWNLVEDTGSGLCVEPGDSRALADAVLQLYRNPTCREAMGQRGREHAERDYSTQTVIAAYDALLRKVAGKAPAATDSRPTAAEPAALS